MFAETNDYISFHSSRLQFARNICCEQDDHVTVEGKKEVCDALGCIYEKCGWKKDGWEDDSHGKDKYDDDKWGSDGYIKKDKYDDDDYKADWGSGGYSKYDDDKYQYKKDYDDDYYQKQKYYAEKKYSKDSDDKCTSEKRDGCCNAPAKKQWEVCIMLDCNPNKVSTNIN